MTDRRTRLMTVLAFAAVYIIWGTTYLGIRYAVDTIPPFLMAGSRFVLAGLAMAIWCAFRHEPAATRDERRQAVIIGAFLLVGGNGLVTWAEQRVPSGIAALLVSTEPLWLVLMLALGRRGTRPTASTLLSLLLGTAGVGLLMLSRLGSPTSLDPVAVGAILVAALSWGAGSIYASRLAPARSTLRQAAWQMTGGGVILMAIGFALGEGGRVHFQSISPASAIAFAYLVIFGSIVAFQAYTYLLRVTTPTRAGTYAYVNPAVAVFVGWAIGGELLGLRELAAMTLIVGAVLLLARASQAAPKPAGGFGTQRLLRKAVIPTDRPARVEEPAYGHSDL